MSKIRFATLTAGLLARKGEAEPAATPFADQVLTRVGAPAQETGLSPMRRHAAVPAPYTEEMEPAAKPPPKALILPMPRLHAAAPPAPVAMAVEEEASCAACPSPAEAGKFYHVNLRLKRQRFVRLKLAAALMRKPVQEIMNESLDAWFALLPEELKGGCACMAGRQD